jgi:UDP-glucuronate 4-epimerase
MHILVTGGAGFIGSAVARRLADGGHSVVVIDNFNSYYDVSLKRARQQSLLRGIEVREGSITDESFLRYLFSEHKFDVVCHFAAQAGVRYSTENPQLYVETNVLGTQLLLEVMKDYGVKRMVYASTSSVYGNDAEVPFREDHGAHKPVSIYAATKRAGELLAHTYASLYGIEVTSLRFFTVYGPWSRPDMAMLKFAQKITAGEPIDIYNNGDLKRDFTFIDDIVEGFVRAVEKPLGYEVINLGSGSPVPLLTFVELLENKLGKKAQKNFLPMQEGDMYETYADTSKARELLGYEPKTSFDDGVQEFVDWYKDYYKE